MWTRTRLGRLAYALRFEGWGQGGRCRDDKSQKQKCRVRFRSQKSQVQESRATIKEPGSLFNSQSSSPSRLANVHYPQWLTPVRTFAGWDPFTRWPRAVNTRRWVCSSLRASRFVGLTSSRTSFVTPLLSYCSVFRAPFRSFLPLHYVSNLSHISTHSLYSCSISSSFHVQVIGRHQFPEQSWQVLSPLHCKFCTTLTPLPDVVSADNPVPSHFLIRTHSNDTHIVSYLPPRYRSMSLFDPFFTCVILRWFLRNDMIVTHYTSPSTGLILVPGSRHRRGFER